MIFIELVLRLEGQFPDVCPQRTYYGRSSESKRLEIDTVSQNKLYAIKKS